MTILIFLPVILPLATATAALLAGRNVRVQRSISVAGMLALLAVSCLLLRAVIADGIQVGQAGGWASPFGITFVADVFSAIMCVMAGLIGSAVAVYALAGMDEQREAFGFHPLLNVLLMGVCGAFLTGDIFNLYVWYEVMLMASFVLLTLGGTRSQLEGGMKYVAMNIVASVIFLAGAGLLYGTVGSLNMADAAVRLPLTREGGQTTVLAALFLVAFGIKAAVFPLFFWLPSSYHTPPVVVTAVFSALLTKVGVYSIVRVMTLMFAPEAGFLRTFLLVVAGATMIVGVLGAVAQMDVRRLLSFHIVSQIGYLLMGVALFTPLALAGTVFFLVHVILSKTSLFLVSGIMATYKNTYDLKKLGGLYRSTPALSFLFLVAAVSLAGLPPSSGFWAKLTLVRAGLENGDFSIVAVALAVSILTLFSMIKIWNEAFWRNPGDAPSDETPETLPDLNPRSRTGLYGPLVVLTVLIAALGLGAGPLLDLSLKAAAQLMHPSEYITAVLGGIR